MPELKEVAALIYKKARKYQKCVVGQEYEDLVQEGALLFLEVQSKFKEEKGTKFSTWFYLVLTNKLNSIACRNVYRYTEPFTDLLVDLVQVAQTSIRLSDLGTDAAWIIEQILSDKMASDTLLKTDIRKYLYKQGWPVLKVNSAFHEIEQYLYSL